MDLDSFSGTDLQGRVPSMRGFKIQASAFMRIPPRSSSRDTQERVPPMSNCQQSYAPEVAEVPFVNASGPTAVDPAAMLMNLLHPSSSTWRQQGHQGQQGQGQIGKGEKGQDMQNCSKASRQSKGGNGKGKGGKGDSRSPPAQNRKDTPNGGKTSNGKGGAMKSAAALPEDQSFYKDMWGPAFDFLKRPAKRQQQHQ